MSKDFANIIKALLRKAEAYDSPDVIQAIKDFAQYCEVEL